MGNTRITVRYVFIVIRMIALIIFMSAGLFSITSVSADTARGQHAVPDGFVNLADFIPDILIDVKYAGNDNFMGRVLEGYEAPKALMLKGPAMALKRVHEKLKESGFRLKVFDAYRPMRAERDMIRWAREKPERVRFLKEGYVPSRVWAGRRVGHVCGNTVDLTIVDPTGKELDMGTPFDEFSKRSWTGNAGGHVRQNRFFLKRVMEAEGFRYYSREWWHFTHPRFPSQARDFVIR